MPVNWIDRSILENNAKLFVQSYGYFLRQNAKRISGLVEVAVYNSITSYYESLGYELKVENPGPRRSFKYKLTANGLNENYSHFSATKAGTDTLLIQHNIRLQSSHDDHLYYTADAVVCTVAAAKTEMQKSGRRHSYVAKSGIITFAEVKHLIPSPEFIFNFSGLVLEFAPDFINGTVAKSDKSVHPAPMIVFTGVAGKHAERIGDALRTRYGFNVIFGTNRTSGAIADFGKLEKYAPPSLKPKVSMPSKQGPRRMLDLDVEPTRKGSRKRLRKRARISS